MPWIVDTCLLIDVAEGDPQFGKGSARLLDRRSSAELLVAPVSYKRRYSTESAKHKMDF